MNREEAIQILDKLWERYDEIHESTDYEQGYEEMEALSMAISALSAEPSDLISRAELIKAIPQTSVDMFENCRNCELLDREQVIDIINEVPSVSVESKATENKYDCDLISRAEAIEAVCNAMCEEDAPYYPECDQKQYCLEIQALKALPSADAVQGEWHQISPARIYECSICNHNVLTDYIDTYNYCPNCGARMKGGAE